MAPQWYFWTCDEQFGPVTFRELIELVRTGALAEADLVRPSWNQDWQRADSVVGLFHMARRSAEELVAIDAPPAAAPAEAPVESEPAAATAPEFEERPGWMKRLWSLKSKSLQFRHRPAPLDTPKILPPFNTPASTGNPAPLPSGERRSEGRTELPPDLASCPTTGPSAEWANAIDAALERVEQRVSRKRRPHSRLGRAFAKLAVPFGQLRGLGRSPWLRPAFRLACAIVCANLVALAIENWSTQEALRFPSRDPQATSLRHFPVLGKCGSGEYLFLIFDAMLITGAAAYTAAAWLEARAE
jgi:GYF domain 2